MHRVITLVLLVVTTLACAATVSNTNARAVDAGDGPTEALMDVSADIPTDTPASDVLALDVSDAGVDDRPAADAPSEPAPRLSVAPGIGRVVRADGTAWVWGDQARVLNHETASPMDAGIALPREAVDDGSHRIYVGDGSFCRVTESSGVTGGFQCWGRNDFGQLGDGTMTSRLEYGAVIASGVTDAASSAESWCVVALGRVFCWGSFSTQIPGIPGIYPVEIFIPVPIVRVFGGAGAKHFLGLDADGALWCWGDNQGAACATDAPWVFPRAVRIPDVPAVRSAVLGTDFSCTLSADRNVRCWGAVPLGLSGEHDGVGARILTVPTLAPAYAGATALTAGVGFVCALMPAGRLVCGGYPYFAWVLGSRPSGSAPFPPLDVPGPENVVEVRSGLNHSCALTATDDVYCWGGNFDHQLGVMAWEFAGPRHLVFP